MTVCIQIGLCGVTAGVPGEVADIAAAMVKQASQLLTRDAIMGYVTELLRQYTELLRYDVVKHPAAILVEDLPPEKPPEQAAAKPVEARLAPEQPNEPFGLGVNMTLVLEDVNHALSNGLDAAIAGADMETAQELCEASERLRSAKNEEELIGAEEREVVFRPKGEIHQGVEEGVHSQLFGYAARHINLDRALVLRTRYRPKHLDWCV